MVKILNMLNYAQSKIFDDGLKNVECNPNRINYRKRLLFFALLFLSFFRSPYIFIHGRFWAEEASSYFRYAFHNNWFDTLFYVYHRTGYYYFFANLNSLIAERFFPLEYAPYVTVYGSALVIFTLLYLTLFADTYFLGSLNLKIIASLVFLLAPCFTAEVWLNSINTQVYFGLIAFILLINRYDGCTVKYKYFSRILLAICGLSGLYAVVLSPFFIFKSFYTKKHEDIVNAAIITICAAIQFIVIMASRSSGLLASTKMTFPEFSALYDVFLHNIMGPVFGRILSGLILSNLNLSSLLESIFAVIFILAFVALLILLKKWKALYVFLAFIAITIFTLFGALNNAIGGRYSVVPGAMFLLCLVMVYYDKKPISSKKKVIEYLDYIFRHAALLLVCVSIVVGLFEFREPLNRNHLEGGPKWSEEVAVWREVPGYQITVWPFPRWRFDLGESKHTPKLIYAQNERTSDAGHVDEIVKGKTIIQPIIINQAMLARDIFYVEVLMATFKRNNTNSLLMKVRQNSHEEEFVINSSYIRDNSYHRVMVETSSLVAGPAELIISSYDGTPGNAITAYLTEDTPMGNASINGQDLGKGLVIRISY